MPIYRAQIRPLREMSPEQQRTWRNACSVLLILRDMGDQTAHGLMPRIVADGVGRNTLFSRDHYPLEDVEKALAAACAVGLATIVE